MLFSSPFKPYPHDNEIQLQTGAQIQTGDQLQTAVVLGESFFS